MALAVVSALASSCTWIYGMREVPLEPVGSALPAADGVVQLMAGSAGDTRVILRFEHLARPSPEETYVVWLSPEGVDESLNVATLEVGNDLRASAMAEVPYRVFRVFVTLERNAAAVAPGGPVLFDAAVGKRRHAPQAALGCSPGERRRHG